jgi:YegS/Rv2252/BmrU family lipid kinase
MTGIVLLNRGGGGAGDDARERVAAALAKAGIDAPIEAVEGGQLAARATAAVEGGATLVIAAGGDGTMSAVAGALAGSDTALGLLPLGTLNHLARDLGIAFDLDEAAAVIAAGNRRTIDLAELNGRPFVNNSAIGLYPLMVVDRDLQRKRLGRSKRLAMLVASLRTLARFHHHRLRLRINNSQTELLDTPLLFVGNNEYSVSLPGAGVRAALDDGRLCVLVLRKKGALGLLAATLRALIGWTRDDDMIRLEDVTRLEVSCAATHLTVAIDGETVRLATPLQYAIQPGALTVLAPAPARE